MNTHYTLSRLFIFIHSTLHYIEYKVKKKKDSILIVHKFSIVHIVEIRKKNSNELEGLQI